MTKAGVTRIVALGGMAILNSENGSLLIDEPNYPAMYKPVGKEHLQAYLYLKESNLDWTVVGSPDIIDEDATGNFTTKPDFPVKGKGKINAGDLALFMLSTVPKDEFVKLRVGISNT